MVWGVWDIVIFWFPGALGNCCFFSTASSPKGGQRVLDVYRPCTSLPAGPTVRANRAAPLPLQKGVSGCWTHKASLYKNTRWPH